MIRRTQYRTDSRLRYRELQDEGAFVLVAAVVLVLAGVGYILVARLHLRTSQILEIVVYATCAAGFAVSVCWHFLTLRKRREDSWPHPPVFVSHRKDDRAVRSAFEQNAIVLGYDVHGAPWLWPDAVRVMQAVVFGATGSGKTTLLRNIITQDLHRKLGTAGTPHRIPMLIFDGKGDQEFLSDLLPAIEAAGRMHQLRLLNPARPDISTRYNPFFSQDDLYQEHSNFVFESFDLKQDFFHGHQATYLNDLVRVLAHSGKRFNIHDVLVMALDAQVMREQIAVARTRLRLTSHRPTKPRYVGGSCPAGGERWSTVNAALRICESKGNLSS
jgi:hypothetical protein